MARFPDGMVFVYKVSGPDEDVSVESWELVLCKNCKWWDKDQTTDGVDGFCPIIVRWENPDFYCANGERRDDGSAAN